MSPRADASYLHLPHIDGLRAIAISLVLLYHFELGGVSRGFLGVDIFFVVSGYLVGGLILRGMTDRSFSVSEFARRRITRLVPASVLTGLLTLAVGMWILLPSELVDAAAGVGAAMLFVANHHYYGLMDYFAPTKLQQHFLHSWSLSVEEQFYFAFPLAAFVLVRLRLPLPLLVGVGVLASLLVAEWLRQRIPNAAFFWMPARAWQFLLGAWIATLSVDSLRRLRLGPISAGTGALLVIGAAFLPSTLLWADNEITRYATSLGTALLLASNIVQPVSRVTAALGWEPVRWLGRISYSLYLVHWPLLTLATAWLITPPSQGVRAILLVASIVLAWVSWRWIEAPLRRIGNSAATPKSLVFVSALFALGTTVALAHWIMQHQGFPSRLSSQGRLYLIGQADVSPKRTVCVSAEGYRPIPPHNACRFGAPVPPDIAIWSDSHGTEIGYALGEAMAMQGRSVLQLVSSACPPLVRHDRAPNPACGDRNRTVFTQLENSTTINLVILASFYDGYDQISAKDHIAGLRETIIALQKSGKKVLIIAPLPRPEFDVPRGLARQQLLAVHKPTVALPRQRHNKRRADWFAVIGPLVDQDRVSLFDPSTSLCTEKNCPYFIDRSPLYFDDDHITLTAARRMVADMKHALE